MEHDVDGACIFMIVMGKQTGQAEPSITQGDAFTRCDLELRYMLSRINSLLMNYLTVKVASRGYRHRGSKAEADGWVSNSLEKDTTPSPPCVRTFLTQEGLLRVLDTHRSSHNSTLFLC